MCDERMAVVELGDGGREKKDGGSGEHDEELEGAPCAHVDPKNGSAEAGKVRRLGERGVDQVI